MTQEQFIQLLQGFHGRQLNEEELHSFLDAAGDPRFESLIGESLLAELSQIKASSITNDERADRIWQHIDKNIHTVPARVRTLKTAWIRYAAAAIIFLAIGAYFWISHRHHQTPQTAQTAPADIPAGREGAILTLGDGSRVTLDSLGNGVVADQHGTQVLLKNGALSYNAANASAVSSNTMTTPRGRQFSVQLPDGSKAWLNAASSITYPTAFSGDERLVNVTGEVYLEVTKDPKRPFKVKINEGTAVEVLGTSFNIKAYAGDASINTTLIEGAVRVSTGQSSQLLSPGQQTRVTPGGNIQLIKNADMQKIMAWKNGLFNFQDESLEEVMRQLERWYDIQVKYTGTPPTKKFFGEMGRDLTLSQVVETLQEVGIQFHIEGRTLIVGQ